MKSISPLNFAQSVYPMVDRASIELQALVKKVANCMPAYFSHYSKTQAIVIFTVSLAIIYTLYAYTKPHKKDELPKVDRPQPNSAKSPASRKLFPDSQKDSEPVNLDSSAEWENMLPPELYKGPIHHLPRAVSISPPKSPSKSIPTSKACLFEPCDVNAFFRDVLAQSTPPTSPNPLRFKPIR